MKDEMEAAKGQVTVELYCVDAHVHTYNKSVSDRVIRGRARINEDCSEIIIKENAPRGPRNSRAGSSSHGKLMKRPDGKYVITLTFDPKEKYISEKLIAEVRNYIRETKYEI